jgi:hypothetical protein
MVVMAKSNPCFAKTVEDLIKSCDDLDDDSHSRVNSNTFLLLEFALELTNCHLKKSGKKTFFCPINKEFQECSNEIEGDAWNTYTTFYTHSENICFYYKSLLWYAESDKMINQLSYVAKEVSNSM